MRVKLPRLMAAAALCLLLAPLTGCQEPEEELEHGVVWLELRRGDSQADNPYVGTSKIEVTLLYRECLIAFYDANPDYQQYGIEGAKIFGKSTDGGEGWQDRLCQIQNNSRVDCTVDSFRQELAMTKQLTITYSVEGNPEDRELPFGPVPTAELADCEGTDDPIVRVGSNGAVRGIDGSGNTLWNTESFNPSEAATDQGAAIGIKAARAGG